jgi:hypothetical protein
MTSIAVSHRMAGNKASRTDWGNNPARERRFLAAEPRNLTIPAEPNCIEAAKAGRQKRRDKPVKTAGQALYGP